MKKKPSFFKYKFNDWSRDFTSLANPIILIFVPFIFLFPKVPRAFVLLLISLVVNEIIGSLIKICFPKTRPNGQKYNTILEKIDAGSFPSLHSSRITIVYFTLSSYTSYPFMKYLFLSIIPIVMLSRINLKKHFWTDIVGGLVIGLCVWWVVFYCDPFHINF